MRILERHLRAVLREQLIEAELLKFERLCEVERPTVGAVLDAIEMVKAGKDAEDQKKRLKKIASTVGWEMVKFIPTVGPSIKAVKTAADLYKLGKDTPDKETRDDVVMDMIDIDDQYQKILDNDLEDKFDTKAIEQLQKLPHDAPLPDMTAELEKWVKQNFKQRGVEGADDTVSEGHMNKPQIRVTKRQLRRIIRESLSPEIWARENGLPVEIDDEGEKVVYVSDRFAETHGLPGGADWDVERTYDDSGWVIYVNRTDVGIETISYGGLEDLDDALMDSGYYGEY